MKKCELADIFGEAIASNKLSASPEQWNVINAVINCRTAVLGGHLYECGDCGKEQPRYNSCRNRHCPKCQGGKTAQWLVERSKELLPVPYFHVVFTLPHELNGIVLQNKRLCYGLLFKAVSQTLSTVAKNRLGGQLGYFGILHTWGQLQEAHNHIHCVIPGIVIKDDGTSEKLSQKYFLPQKVLSKVFRGIFSKLIVKEHRSLEFHGQQIKLQKYTDFRSYLQWVNRKDWVVYAKRPFSGPSTVLKYLAQYTHRVAISNSRIIKCENGKVTFSYKDYSDNAKRKEQTLSIKEFCRRFLLHVLPKRFVRIRHFGFLTNALKKKNLSQLRDSLEPIEQQESAPEPPKCSHCGGRNFTHIREIAKIRPLYRRPPQKHPKPKTKELPLVA
jgi:hypothetical protein